MDTLVLEHTMDGLMPNINKGDRTEIIVKELDTL